MTSDDTPLAAIRQAVSALRAGTTVGAPDGPDGPDLGLLGHESRALVEQLIDVLHGVDRVVADPQDPRSRDLADLRSRLGDALHPHHGVRGGAATAGGGPSGDARG